MNEMPKFGDLAANGEAPPKKRKYTRRAKADPVDKPKRKYKRKAKAAREWSCFLGEDNAIQLCPFNGEGESIDLTAADALAIADFVNRHRKALEA